MLYALIVLIESGVLKHMIRFNNNIWQSIYNIWLDTMSTKKRYGDIKFIPDME